MRRSNLWLALVLLALLGAMAAKSWLIELPPLRSQSASGEFDATRAKARLAFVLGDQRPHPADTPANDVVRGKIVTLLQSLGLTPIIRDQAACNELFKARGVVCARVRNVIAVLGPPTGKAVLLNAHYDSTPVGPGAADDGIGVATLLEVGSILKDQPLRERIESLLRRCGFASKGVFVVDNSRRSSHGNAYFTGIGRHKRIVFFDTLLERLAHPEVEAVLAHELGHFRLKHVRKRLLLSMAASLAGLALLGWLTAQPGFYRALGVPLPSTHAALLLFMLVVPAFMFFITPLASLWSRRHEFEADEFASRYASPAELATALVKLHRDNASTLTPDPVYAAFYYSHPPPLVRISRLRAATGAPAT